MSLKNSQESWLRKNAARHLSTLTPEERIKEKYVRGINLKRTPTVNEILDHTSTARHWVYAWHGSLAFKIWSIIIPIILFAMALQPIWGPIVSDAKIIHTDDDAMAVLIEPGKNNSATTKILVESDSLDRDIVAVGYWGTSKGIVDKKMEIADRAIPEYFSGVINNITRENANESYHEAIEYLNLMEKSEQEAGVFQLSIGLLHVDQQSKSIQILDEYAPRIQSDILYYGAGTGYFYSGDYANATNRLEYALNISNNSVYRVDLATSLWFQGHTPEAVEQIEIAIKEFPNASIVWEVYGNILAEFASIENNISYLEMSEKAFLEAIKFDNTSASTHYNLGITYRDLNKLNDSLAAYNDAETLAIAQGRNDLYWRAKANKITILSRQNRLTEALNETYLLETLGAPKQFVESRKIGLLTQMGRYALADDVAREVINNSRTTPEFYSNYAYFLELTGDCPGAEAANRMALHLNSNLPLARARLNQLPARCSTNKYNTQLIELDRRYRNAPTSHNVNEKLRALIELEYYEATFWTTQEVLDVNPCLVGALFALHDSLIVVNETQRAQQALDQSRYCLATEPIGHLHFMPGEELYTVS